MPPATSITPDPAGVLVALLVAGLLVAVVLVAIGGWAQGGKSSPSKRGQADQRERKAPFAPQPSASLRFLPPAKLTHAADQLRIVMGAEFVIQPLLNRSEARVFAELDRAVAARNPSWRVMAQVSLGEILVARDPEAYRCINSKRVDLLLMDGRCQPRHAIEYQGGAHHQGTAAARDAVKKEALRRAGIGYHEVIAGFTTPAELRRLVEKLVDRADEPARADQMVRAP